MEMRTLSSDGKISFELTLERGRFSRLRVTDARSETMWDLAPTPVEQIPIEPAESSFVEVPGESAEAVMEVMQEAVRDLELPGGAPEQTTIAAMEALSRRIQARQEAGDLPERTAKAVTKALAELSGEGTGTHEVRSEEANWQVAGEPRELEDRPITRVVYGQVPDGYRQVQKARPLVHGETYCIVVFGSEPFEVVREHFIV